MKIYMLRAVPLPRTGQGWNILVLFESCLQNCMTYTSAECTVNKLLMMGRGNARICRFSCQNKFGKLVHLVGFIIKKCDTMHGHMNVKLIKTRLMFLLSHAMESTA